MSVSVSYPGVYVEEFTPGAPIAGVGTSVAGFVGTAAKGPIATPTRVQSWDAFVSTFGGFPESAPPSWLACGVYGYFLNGGTDCYVLRVATGRAAQADLDSRVAGSPAPALMVEARNEGVAGNALSVQAADSSRLATHLRQAAVGAAGTAGPAATPPTTLALHRSETSVSAQPDASAITVASSAGFAARDSIALSPPPGGNEAPIPAMVRAVPSADTIRLVAPLPTGTNVANWSARTGDVVPGQTVLRVDVPAGLTLSQAVPGGSTVSLTSGQTGEVGTVATAGGDTVTLAASLTNRFPLDASAPPATLASLEFDLVVTDSGPARADVRRAVHECPPSRLRGDGRAVDACDRTYAGHRAPRRGCAPQAGHVPADRRRRRRPRGRLGPAAERPGRPAGPVAPVRGDLAGEHPGCGGRRRAAGGRNPLRVDVQPVRRAGHRAWPRPGRRAGATRPGALGAGLRGAVLPVDQRARPAHRSAEHVAALGPRHRGVRPDRRHPRRAQGTREPSAARGTGSRAPADGHRTESAQPRRRQRHPGVPGAGAAGRLGARTTAGSLDRNWQYVNVRRLFLFLEQSIQQGIRWAVFEPNDLGLWQRLKRTIGEFLTRVWRDGALFGATAEEAF